LAAGALLAGLLDRAVAHLDDRLDRQRRAEQCSRVADATALLQVLERVERADHAGTCARSVASCSSSSSVGTGARRPRAGQRDRADAEGDRATVDHAHVDVDVARGERGALHRGRQRS
jgi:hypothetical protein